MSEVTSASAFDNVPDAEYRDYLSRVSTRFLENSEGRPLFATDADGLFAAYLDALSADERQAHQCHACRQFIERFGGLVTIDEQGETRSAIWDVEDAIELYKPATAALLEIVRVAKVTGVFLSSAKTWGQPVTGIWHHLSVRPWKVAIYKSRVQTDSQAMAEKREDFKNMSTALDDFTRPVIEQALRLLESEALYRSEKVLGAATWLLDLHSARDSKSPVRKANILWRAVATAPPGYCHPRSSMIGTLLEDIAAGKDFEEVSRSFAAKMHPLLYQRPQTAPSAGTIAQAEKVVAELKAAGSLARRYARLDEVKALWKPKSSPKGKTGEGVFSHLTPKGSPNPSAMQLPPVAMTWEKFHRTILPAAEKIELQTRKEPDHYCVLVTAVDPEAPPILQWDRDEERNPVSWYLWHGGSKPDQFGLPSGVYVDVAAITLQPSMWGSKTFAHQGESVIFVLVGARETRNAGAALFPEILQSEFHGIRSVIEAYSRGAIMQEIEGSHVAGPMLRKGGFWKARVRVTSNGQSAVYDLDRWD